MAPRLAPTIFLTLLPLSLLISQTQRTYANPVEYELYGSLSGWGFTPSTITSPGPQLGASPGETVFMTLHSRDGVTHNFGIDYNGNGFRDTGEPASPFFSGSATVEWSFVARSTPGSFTYICFLHGSPMIGPFEIATVIHDVATTAMTISRNFAYSDVASNPILIDVTVNNQGSASETFPVTVSADNTIIGSQTVTVPAGGSTIVSFNWNPSLFSRGVYGLSAQASQVSAETDLSDNSIQGGVFAVRMKGDVSDDCAVDIIDLAIVGSSFGKTSNGVGFNSNADLNNDLTVDIIDLAITGASFGRHC